MKELKLDKYQTAFNVVKSTLSAFAALTLQPVPTDEQVRQYIHFARLGVKVRLKRINDGKTWLLDPNDKDLRINSPDRDAILRAAKNELAGFSHKLIG